MSSAPTKPTTREAQRSATRERVFSEAVVEFKRAGIDGADVGAIVEAAGVAHGTFFFHFATKEHVLAELGQREEVRMAAELDAVVATSSDLGAILDEVVRMTGRLERRLGTVLFRDLLALYFSPARPELDLWSDHPFVARVIGEFERACRGMVAIAGVDPANSAMFFLLGLYGLLITHVRDASRAELLDQFVTTSLRSLGLR